MDPNLMVVTIAVIFASLFVVDRWTSIPKERSRNEEHTRQRLAELAQLKEMTGSASDLLQALHGGTAGQAIRTIVPEDIRTINSEDRASGSASRYTTTPPPAGFPGHRAATTTDR